MKSLTIPAAIASLFVSSFVYAQTATPAPATAPAEDNGISFSGYVETSYNHLSQGNKYTSGVPDRAFDLEKDGFAVRQVAFTLSKQAKEGFGGLLNVTAGKDADVLNAFGAGAGHNNKFDMTQVYGQYATGPFSIIAGKFVTLAGAEVNTSPSNPNFSRSYLFQLGPYTHTGVRATYAANDTLNLILGANQGWDNFKETNGAKTLEYGLSYAPSKTLSLTASGYTGKERVGGWVESGPEGTRNLWDVVGVYNATDKLTYTIDAAYGSQANATLPNGSTGTAKWSGIAGYASYQISDQWRLSARVEDFDDQDGYRTGVAQNLKEGTLTLGYLPAKAIEIRAEVRGDYSNVASFSNPSGTSASKSNKSFGLQALYKF